jgi:hypothetical protein
MGVPAPRPRIPALGQLRQLHVPPHSDFDFDHTQQAQLGLDPGDALQPFRDSGAANLF